MTRIPAHLFLDSIFEDQNPWFLPANRANPPIQDLCKSLHRHLSASTSSATPTPSSTLLGHGHSYAPSSSSPSSTTTWIVRYCGCFGSCSCRPWQMQPVAKATVVEHKLVTVEERLKDVWKTKILFTSKWMVPCLFWWDTVALLNCSETLLRPMEYGFVIFERIK